MKIFISHSRVYDFNSELYIPLKNSVLSSEHTFIYPHEDVKQISSKKMIEDCDLLLAEVSFPSTGMGIELGWADMLEKRIIAIHKDDTHPSPSLQEVTKMFISYTDPQDMIEKLGGYLKK